jgi:hypothetical protein
MEDKATDLHNESETCSSVTTVTKPRAGQPGSIPDRGGDGIFLLAMASTPAVAQPASYPLGTGAPSTGVKRPKQEADHSPLSTAEVKMSHVRLHDVVHSS